MKEEFVTIATVTLEMADGSSDSQKLVFEDGLEINPLANPKGVSLVCHLCQKPARLLCPHCRVIHYW